MRFHYRFKPVDLPLTSDNSRVQIKSKTIYINPNTKPSDVTSDGTNLFRFNFRANPKPSGCQWKQSVAVNQSPVSCSNQIKSNGNEDGEYFVNFSQTQVLTQESSIVISITNDINMSNFTFDIVLPELYLEIDKKRTTDAIKIEENEEKSIDCVAVGVYYKPEFKWFLANESLFTTNAVIEIEPLDKKVSYTSTLTYKGSSKDLNKTLKCEIHQIHNKTELPLDIIKAEAELNLG